MVTVSGAGAAARLHMPARVPSPLILPRLPPLLPAQVGVFSATLPPEALEITRKFMNKPVGGASCIQ